MRQLVSALREQKRVRNRKIVAKISDFLFLQQANHRDKADPRKLSNEDRVKAKRGAKRNCHPSGPRHLGRLPASTHIAPTGQNGIKKQKATEENPRWPVLLMVPATGIEPATH